MKVLLVEENSAVRGFIRQLVASPGTWIQECVDSSDATSAYAASRPDLVIMDIGMKDLDGIAVMQADQGNGSSGAGLFLFPTTTTPPCAKAHSMQAHVGMCSKITYSR